MANVPEVAIPVRLDFADIDHEAFARWLERQTRASEGIVRAAIAEPREWVLVKGTYDSDSIWGVYGPYTEAYADWLLAGPLEYHSSNWTKIKLSSGPEET